MSIYFKLSLAYLRGQMQHRGSFAMSVARNLISSVGDLLRLVLLGVSFGAMGHWTGAQIAVLYGIITVSFAVASALGAGLFSFSGVIRRGDFDRVLLRPCGALTQVLGSKFDLTRFGRLTTGVVGLAWGIAHLDTPFGLAQGAMTALCIFSGVLLFLGILMIQGGTCFWTIEGMEAFNAITYGGVAMASYPLEVYRGWLREVFLFVIPLGCLNYLPCAVLFGKSLPYPAFTAYLAPVAGGEFLLLGFLVWRAGMRHYRSVGA